ncbi:MAG: peptidoglycan-binding domain-containing protein, partial [Microcystaceae cyanobacterium]
GFYKGAINGIFSPEMQSAVIAFQKSEHIKPDGIIGHDTQAAMK